MKKNYISFIVFLVLILFTGCSYKTTANHKSDIKNKYNYIYNNLQETNYIAYNKVSYKSYRYSSVEYDHNILYTASAVYYNSDNAFSIIRKLKTTGEVNECFYKEGKLKDYSFYIEPYLGRGEYNFESDYNSSFQDEIYEKCTIYLNEMYNFIRNKKY